MNDEVKYVFQFRGPVRSELCSILDLNDKWRELAALLGYSVRDVEQIDKIARTRSPSDVLLEQWGQKAPTMHKLFVALSEIQHYQALMLLKDFVPEEFHILIYEGEENLDTEDDGDGAEADSECFSRSDTNNIVSQNDGATKQLNSKLIDINRAIAINSSTSNREEVLQPTENHTSSSEICNIGHHSPRFKLLEQQEVQTFPPNVLDRKVHVQHVFHNITEQGIVNQTNARAELAISAPPGCFVPPEVLNAPTSSAAFSGYVPVSPWLNSEPYCTSMLSQVEYVNPSASNPNGLENNKTSPESPFSTAGMPSSTVSTSEGAPGPPRRVLGSSLASKKLILGAL